MPKIAKWLGDSMETVFSSLMFPLKVTNSVHLTNRLKRIKLEGDLGRTNFTPGNVVQFRVNDTDFRHYTPSLYNKEQGICEILFYLHDKGAGSKWAQHLKPGSEVKLIGPGGRLKYEPKSKYHFFFGDETSLSLFVCLKAMVEQNNQDYLCLLELEEENFQWPDLLNLSADVVRKSSPHHAQEAIIQLNEIQGNCWSIWSTATFYLTGNAKSIQAVRKALTLRGVKSKQIQTEPYWAEGKQGL